MIQLRVRNQKINQNKLLGLRLKKQTDSKIRTLARKQGKSINLFCSEILEGYLEKLNNKTEEGNGNVNLG